MNMQSIRIATFNVKNFFAREDIGKNTRAHPKSERSMEAVAETLQRLDADVVTLQEITSRETLENYLLTRRNLAEKYPYVAWKPGNDGRGINVGVISKFPFNAVVSHREAEFPLVDGSGDTGKFNRDLLRVDINTDHDPETELSVYTTHAKSRFPSAKGRPDADVLRASQERAAREIIEKEMKPYPARLYVLTGDLNDGPEDPSVQELLNPADGGEIWLDSLDHLEEPANHTWPSNPIRKRYPSVQFDHIIYPGRFDDQLLSSEKICYKKSLDTDTLWVSSAASDHLAVVATFEIPSGGSKS